MYNATKYGVPTWQCLTRQLFMRVALRNKILKKRDVRGHDCLPPNWRSTNSIYFYLTNYLFYESELEEYDHWWQQYLKKFDQDKQEGTETFS
jgi:hypothetical protein